MTSGAIWWRVGYHADPVRLKQVPLQEYSFGHRFDDARRRFRTLYCAERPQTCLMEVLADYRPNRAAMLRHIERYGPEAAEDFASEPVTRSWLEQNVLVQVTLEDDSAELVDLTDPAVRYDLEKRHAQLLAVHGMDHLDLHEITSNRRPLTQAIAADLFDRGAGGMRFLSRLDGQPCFALIEGRAAVRQVGSPLTLTAPAPPALAEVAQFWGLTLET
ncbi:RES domain-containing protein [Mycobacteroides abscessus]|uniref:RES domain-containing protein n=1 Tax=Mycobacteroides abscessus TaxID=36809 RepID=UPI002106DAE5|nr:RES domain-containing protein [Mycobacteroides abscessus]